MIEIAIISFGIGAVLGGVTFFGGYKTGYKLGHADGYKKALCPSSHGADMGILALLLATLGMNNYVNWGTPTTAKQEKNQNKETAE